MSNLATQGKRGRGKNTYAYWEELRHLKIEGAEPVSIFKRLDTEKHIPVEQRNYYVFIPVPNTRGIKKSLRVVEREIAVFKAEEEIVNVKVKLAQGASVRSVSVVELVERFLAYKRTLVRGAWESKEEAGRRSITKERYVLIEGKLYNYLVLFLGKKTDVRNVPFRKWNEWEMWRKLHLSRKDMGKPKAITIQNEMGVIRECWRWGMENGLIPFSPKLPFHGENLITDDKVRRDTWEANEWSSFARRVRDWLKSTSNDALEANVWDAFVAYQMLFFLANSGMRVGELVKVKRKDIRFYKRKNGSALKSLCALVQVHPSTKTGAREVNAMGGDFAKRVYDKSKFKTKGDFLFCHLDGTPFTTKQFRSWFNRMITFTNENERWGKHFLPYGIRHLYATIRLQNGTSRTALCENMGVTEPYLRKHYSHYLTRLATEDLMKINSDIGIGGTLIPDGEDFVIPEVTE